MEKPKTHTIYLEADSEITEAIDKLRLAHAHEVRIAVPARSTMLQSAVNLKLLKKASVAEHKKLVLVSTDRATLSLAAGLGLLVASNVKAEAAVPSMAALGASAAGVSAAATEGFSKTHIALNDSSGSGDSNVSSEEPPVDADTLGQNLAEPSAGKNSIAKSKNSKGSAKVPNFSGLNKKILALVIAGFVLILLVVAYVVLPTATVTLAARAQRTPLSLKFSLDSESRRSDFEKNIVAAEQVSTTKELTGQLTPTGQKETGQKATGTVTIKNCDDTSSKNLASGAALTSAGKGFATTQAVVIPAGVAGGGVVSCGAGVDVGVTASAVGDGFNLGGATFSITGLSLLFKATGSTSGGSSKVVTVVTAQDVELAKKQLLEQANSNAKQELARKTDAESRLFEQTFASEIADFVSPVAVDAEASGAVTVTAKGKFSALASKKSELDAYFANQISAQLPQNSQIYQSGAAEAEFTLEKAIGPTKAQMQAKGDAFYGESINTSEVSKSLAGKGRKDATDIVKSQYPQVSGVMVDTVPSLVPNLPFFAGKITIKIQVSTE